jgi:hypothetical protein
VDSPITQTTVKAAAKMRLMAAIPLFCFSDALAPTDAPYVGGYPPTHLRAFQLIFGDRIVASVDVGYQLAGQAAKHIKGRPAAQGNLT